MPVFRPIGPSELVVELASYLALADRSARHNPAVRVAIDGAPATQPTALAQSIVSRLSVLSRPSVHIRADHFLRDASVRLEYGHTDAQAFAHGWLDRSALRREVLEPLGPSGTGWFLPSLRDPVNNRATRAARELAEGGSIVLISGALLLHDSLPFDVRIHLAMSSAALARHTDPDQLWTLPAFANYDREVGPTEIADVVARLEDPRRPAIRYNDARSSID